MAHLGRHAVVIGASMSGLLAARALVDHYDQVTLIDRDALPLACEPRKGESICHFDPRDKWT
jgi:glycine/D-amino acid oxidase-like deaminating enzyme